MSRADDELTVTSYAILGLLALKPWTTYELAQQMRRGGLRNIWPRAASRIYEEPKRLVAEGLARATSEYTGQRPRTIYAITPKGRRRLARWLGEPGVGPELEFELLLKVWLSEHGTKADVLARVDEIARWAEERNAENVAFAREYVASGGPFPQRLAQIVLVGKFLTDFADMVSAWSTWAAKEIDTWPDDARQAPPSRAVMEQIASRRLASDPPA